MLIFQGATPVLQVDDVARSVAWYTEALGFSGDPFPDAPPYEFAILTRDRAEVMLQRRRPAEAADAKGSPPAPPAAPPPNGWSVYLRLKGGELLPFAEAVRARTTILRGPERMFYQQVEFEVADPDGHRICVGEPLPPDVDVPAARED
ncbi:MAG: VOC family protein [Isosphaeraceae bacterium]